MSLPPCSRAIWGVGRSRKGGEKSETGKPKKETVNNMRWTTSWPSLPVTSRPQQLSSSQASSSSFGAAEPLYSTKASRGAVEKALCPYLNLTSRCYRTVVVVAAFLCVGYGHARGPTSPAVSSRRRVCFVWAASSGQCAFVRVTTVGHTNRNWEKQPATPQLPEVTARRGRGFHMGRL